MIQFTSVAASSDRYDIITTVCPILYALQLNVLNNPNKKILVMFKRKSVA